MSSIKRRPDGVWRARYRDEAGKEHSRHFKRKVDGQRWLDEVTASVVTGTYVQPGAGKVTFRAYAEDWRATQVHRPGTAELVERHLRRSVYPAIGDLPLANVRQFHLQAMVSGWELAPSTAQVVWRFVAMIFKSAVDNRRIGTSPCVGVKLPEIVQKTVAPLSTEQVRSIIVAMPARYQTLVILAAGTGMRQGEIFGLTQDRIAFLERKVTVDRQLVTSRGQTPMFGPPKTRSSNRTIPLPDVVLDALAAHLAEYDVEPEGLVFTGSQGQPLRRSAFGDLWRRTMRQAGTEGITFHALRHYYASLLIRHGESVTTVQARLGHASADETLRTYAHMWPDADVRTRAAVDAVLGAPADSVRTG